MTVRLRAGCDVSAALLAALTLAGCYQSHTSVTPDAGPHETDARPLPSDAGPDARPPRVDSGPRAMDGGPPPDLCVMIDPLSPEPIEIEFDARIRSADVTLLVDATGSMVQEIARLRAILREEILPGLAEVVPDLRVSVAQVTDFEGDHGSYSSLFGLRAASTSDPDVLQAGVDAIWLEHGGDGPEGQVVALWLTATGNGWDRRLVIPVPPRDCPDGTVGYPCFPSHGARIAVLYTDAAFHNGPGGAYPYDPAFGAPTYDEMLGTMRDIGARAVGVYSGAPGAQGEMHLSALARDTRAIDLARRPIVRPIGRDGTGLAEGTIAAVRTFVEEAPLDLDLFLEDVPGDARDALELVSHVETAGAVPDDGVGDEDGARFDSVRPGTTVRFRIVLRDDVLRPADAGRVYRLGAVLRESGVVRLERPVLDLVVMGGDVRCTD